MARYASGWPLPGNRAGDIAYFTEMRTKISRALDAAGRDPSEFTFAGQVDCGADASSRRAALDVGANSAQQARTTSSWAFRGSPPLTASCQWHARSRSRCSSSLYEGAVTTLQRWSADGVGVGRAVVVRTYGSAPRQPGAVLLYASDGRVAGSVSGGCVEGAAAKEIETARESGKTRTIRYGITDEQAWSVGLACGGTIDVLIEPEVPEEAVDAAFATPARLWSRRCHPKKAPTHSLGLCLMRTEVCVAPLAPRRPMRP